MPHTVVCAVGAIIDLAHADQPSGDRATLSKKTLSRKWCPGTESNRRHCDFQSLLQDIPLMPSNTLNVAISASSGNLGAPALP
jgi:hypothetical protein